MSQSRAGHVQAAPGRETNARPPARRLRESPRRLVIQTNCKHLYSFLGPYINSCCARVRAGTHAALTDSGVMKDKELELRQSFRGSPSPRRLTRSRHRLYAVLTDSAPEAIEGVNALGRWSKCPRSLECAHAHGLACAPAAQSLAAPPPSDRLRGALARATVRLRQRGWRVSRGHVDNGVSHTFLLKKIECQTAV